MNPRGSGPGSRAGFRARARTVLGAGSAVALLLGPATADGATPRWTPTGPAPGLGTPVTLGAGGGTSVAIHRDPTRREVDLDATTQAISAAALVRAPDVTVRSSRLFPARGYGVPLVVRPGVAVVPIRLDGPHRTAGLRTTDGGRSWDRVLAPRCLGTDPSWTGGAFQPDGSGVMLGWDGGAGECVWRSEDAGATWRVVATAPPLQDVVAVAGGRYVAVARAVSGTDIEGGVLASDDGGATWQQVRVPPSPTPAPRAGYPADQDLAPVATRAVAPVLSDGRDHVVVGSDSGALLESADGGRTFARRPVPPGDPSDAPPERDVTTMPVALRPDGATIATARSRSNARADRLLLRDGVLVRTGPTTGDPEPLAGSPAALFRLQTAAGRTTLLRDPGSGETAVAGGRTAPGDLGTAGLVAVVRDGRLWRSTDGGARWSATTIPGGVRPVAVAPSRGGDVVVDARGGLRRIGRDGAWRSLPAVPGLRPRALAVDRGVVVVAGTGGVGRIEDGRLRRTGGPAARRRWTRAAGGDGQVVATDERGRVLRSTDAGRTWSPTARIRRGRPVAVAVAGPRTIVAISDLRLWTSRDGGRTFRPGARVRRPRGAWSGRPGRIVPRGARSWIVATYGQLLRTDDGGRTVRRVPLPPEVTPETVADGRGGRLLVQDDVTGDLLRSTPVR